ncbi:MULTISPECIES: hypothetical protein [unclassified Nocardia]|uniref:hypothetical protein n=1 Tax=unclassified Nocardia TaxID=2637762 RepID=UPI002E217B45
MISETTSTLYEIVSVTVRKVSASSTNGVDSSSVSTRLCFDCDFCRAVRYCLAAQIESLAAKMVVGRGNKQGMSCVHQTLSVMDRMGPT